MMVIDAPPLAGVDATWPRLRVVRYGDESGKCEGYYTHLLLNLGLGAAKKLRS